MFKQKVVWKVSHPRTDGVMPIVRNFKSDNRNLLAKKFLRANKELREAGYTVHSIKQFPVREV